MNDPNTYEPDPIPNKHKAVWPQVLADLKEKIGIPPTLLEDMRSRDQFGLKKYGTQLQPFNGRNPIRDAYQEALDLCVYTKQATIENPADREVDEAHGKAVRCAIALRQLLDKKKE